MRRRVFLVVAWCLVSLGGEEYLSAQQRDSALWLPPEVQGWISIPDLDRLDESWRETQFGRLLESKLFEKVVDAWKQQGQRRKADVTGLLVSWEDIRMMASGEVALAVVMPRGQKPTPVLLVDYREKADQVGEVIRRFDTRLRPPGKAHQVELEAHREFSPVVVEYVRRQGRRKRTLLVYFYYQGVFCLTKDVEVAKAIRRRMEAGEQQSLATDPVFQATMKSLQAQQSDRPVHLRWFVRPLGLAQAARTLYGRILPNQVGDQQEEVDWLDVFQRTGFEQIQGAAGMLTLAGKAYDVEHRIKIYAPRPWKGAVNVLSLYNHQRVWHQPPPWISGKLASVARLRLDVLRTFDNIGPLFNQILAGGAEGTWESSLESIRNDPDGPQVDLRQEIMAQLEHDCLLLSAANKAKDHDRPRRVVILSIKEKSHKLVAAAIDRYFKPEQGATPRTDLVPGAKIWVLLPREDQGPEIQVGPVQVDVGDQQSAVVVPAPKPKPSEPEGICVYGGHLFYATHLSLLVELLKNLQADKPSGTPVAQLPEFQRVHEAARQEAQKQQWNTLSFFRFENPVELYRNTYQLAVQNQIAQSQNTAIKILIALGRLVDKDGKQLVDGKLLPPFEQVADQFPPGGLIVHTDTDGWSIVSFMLHRKKP